MTKLWLGTTDRYARLRQIENLDLETQFREITGLFYADFQSVMMPQSFNGFLMTFASPRISRILINTGEIEHRVAKRVVDTMLLSSAVMAHGLNAEPGRGAARRVNAMHKNYDIHEDDFVAVGCDEIVNSLDLAGRYGWRPVTEKEREAVRLYYTQQSRAFGSRKPLPDTVAGVQKFWSDYLDKEAAFEPQNRRLTDAVIKWYEGLVPKPLRRLFITILLADADPRVIRACGLRVPPRIFKSLAGMLMRRMGQKDPIPDNAPNRMQALVASVYPNGWEVNELGSHIQAKS
ncbi:oxygenase MpaB family protein [Acidocella sp.]|uniref:oxygenase MpaB family protein n=2 Tax=Acidocella sp. TaxID=50710 RepID=UPI002612EAC1|nr:oxygenase MpaB family protein [Acidocella sp.]